jgi:hypothetical protein
MRTGAEERVIYEHHFSVAVLECPSLNKGRPTHRPEGDGDEGSKLRTTFFPYKNKKATLYLSGFWFSSRIWQHYLITLSALASTFGGIVRPICFAALRLMMNSNLVACCTGKSVGLAPFKILST